MDEPSMASHKTCVNLKCEENLPIASDLQFVFFLPLALKCIVDDILDGQWIFYTVTFTYLMYLYWVIARASFLQY